MPFCPSLEPCAKLTPEQVATSRPRIQPGGRPLLPGDWFKREKAGKRRSRKSKNALSANPKTGEISSDSITPSKVLKFTPAQGPRPLRTPFIIPTPSSEPIKACELEAGIPK